MRITHFDLTASGAIVSGIAGRKIVFYGCEFVLSAGPPTDLQFVDGIGTPLSPVYDGLIVGVVHQIPIVYGQEGFPIVRGVGGVNSFAGVNITGAGTMRGTFFWDVAS